MKFSIPKTDKPLAFSYIRMSTDKQLKGDSLRRQKQQSEEYAEENGLYLVEDLDLRDIGVSAFKGDNVKFGALSAFLEATKEGKIPPGSFLLVESLDRISRQEIGKSLSLFLDITSNGVSIATLSDNQLYEAGKTELQQLLYSIVVMSRAHEESEQKSKRLSSAWKNKRQNAQNVKLTGICPAWLELDPDRDQFSALPDRAAVVKRIFKLASQGMGSLSIAKQLNQENVETFGRSVGWATSSVSKLLNNRAVLGEYSPHQMVSGKRVPTGEIIDDYYPQIIDERTFLRVRSGRNKRATVGAGRKGVNYTNLFTQLAKCEYCGSRMHLVNKGKGPKGGRYLKCYRAIKGNGCDADAWKYDDFETSFLFFIREVDLKGVVSSAEEVSETQNLSNKKSEVTQALADAENKRERTYDLVNDSAVSSDFLKDKLQECEEQILDLKERLTKIETDLQNVSVTAKLEDEAEILDAIDQVQKTDNDGSFALRASLAQRFRDIILDLRLGRSGTLPQYKKMEQEPLPKGIDPKELRQVLDQINETNIESGNYQPRFIVQLSDGTHRLIVVDNKDPKKLVKNVAYKDELSGNFRDHISTEKLVDIEQGSIHDSTDGSSN